jgi:hypothetical protein
MSPGTAATIITSGPSDVSGPRLLRIHGERSTTDRAARFGAIAAEEPEALAAWDELLGGFLDRRAAARFLNCVRDFRPSVWKPRLALVLPVNFSWRRLTHRHDLTVALEVLSSVMAQYNLTVISDSLEAARLFREVKPFRYEAISACAGALVLLSRSLNDEVGAIRPSRYISADPCAYRSNKKRIVFTAGGIELPLTPVDDLEVVGGARGRLSVFIDEDDEASSYLEALGRIRSRGVPLRITLSSRSDEDFARGIHESFASDPRVEVRDAGPPGPDDPFEFQVSNEPISLMGQPPSGLARFQFHKDRFWRVGNSLPRRSDFYMLRGEELNSSEVMRDWLGRGECSERGRSVPRLSGVTDPLVSVIVPIYDRTAEIIRLAHSLYEQDYPWIEVVFVSNGSPPETLEAVRIAEHYLMKRRFRVRIIELSCACGSATIPRDIGIMSCSGDLICVLDSDDWLDPGFFDFIQNGPCRDDTVFYPKKIFRDHGRAMGADFPFEHPLPGLGTLENADFIPHLRRHGNFLNNSGVCFSRALFDRAGGIDHRLSYGEDLYLWCRLARVGARAEEHCGRVNISLHPGNNELAVGDESRLNTALELAVKQEVGKWL